MFGGNVYLRSLLRLWFNASLNRTFSPLEDWMGIKVHVIFYSMYGHVYRMAEAVLAGVKEVAGAEASLLQVAELVPDAILEKSGAKGARAAFAHVPIATMDSLAEPQAVIFGTPTRFGNMAAQMRNFLDQTGGVLGEGTPIGENRSGFCSHTYRPR